jgi:sugar phosphate permease
MNSTKKYWFPAKQYGWGWGIPSTWQGWLVLLSYTAGIAFVAALYPPDSNGRIFFPGIIGLSIALIVICWIKGEPPRWRWGK